MSDDDQEDQQQGQQEQQQPDPEEVQRVEALQERLGDLPWALAAALSHTEIPPIPATWPGGQALLEALGQAGSGDPVVSPPQGAGDGLPEWAGFAQQQAFPPPPEQGLPGSAFPTAPYEQLIHMGYFNRPIGEGFDIVPWSHPGDTGIMPTDWPQQPEHQPMPAWSGGTTFQHQPIAAHLWPQPQHVPASDWTAPASAVSSQGEPAQWPQSAPQAGEPMPTNWPHYDAPQVSGEWPQPAVPAEPMPTDWPQSAATSAAEPMPQWPEANPGQGLDQDAAVMAQLGRDVYGDRPQVEPPNPFGGGGLEGGEALTLLRQLAAGREEGGPFVRHGEPTPMGGMAGQRQTRQWGDIRVPDLDADVGYANASPSVAVANNAGLTGAGPRGYGSWYGWEPAGLAGGGRARSQAGLVNEIEQGLMA